MDKLAAKGDGSASRMTFSLKLALEFHDLVSPHLIPVVALRLHLRTT
jgi:hypothetical protein